MPLPPPPSPPPAIPSRTILASSHPVLSQCRCCSRARARDISLTASSKSQRDTDPSSAGRASCLHSSARRSATPSSPPKPPPRDDALPLPPPGDALPLPGVPLRLNVDVRGELRLVEDGDALDEAPNAPLFPPPPPLPPPPPPLPPPPPAAAVAAIIPRTLNMSAGWIGATRKVRPDAPALAPAPLPPLGRRAGEVDRDAVRRAVDALPRTVRSPAMRDVLVEEGDDLRGVPDPLAPAPPPAAPAGTEVQQTKVSSAVRPIATRDPCRSLIQLDFEAAGEGGNGELFDSPVEPLLCVSVATAAAAAAAAAPGMGAWGSRPASRPSTHTLQSGSGRMETPNPADTGPSYLKE